MKDRKNRTIDYLRISLTDRCNLRCVYCMPEEGIRRISHEEILTFDEILRICGIAAGLGVKKIKLTGGEPLVRKNCATLVCRIKEIPGIENVTMTTNGILLKDQIRTLADAGLDAVNVSLDTLDPEMFRQITRRGGLEQTLEGIHAALEIPGMRVKINCVPVAGLISPAETGNNGVRDGENDRRMLENSSRNLIEIAQMAKDYPVHVRFIEIMPIGFGKKFVLRREEEIRQVLEETYGPMMPDDGRYGNGPSHYFAIDGFQGRIGFISAVSHKFCDRCNRVRLTSEGFLKGCLQFREGEDLRERMRDGCTDEELRSLIVKVISEKPDSHNFYEQSTDLDESRIMSQIGG